MFDLDKLLIQAHPTEDLDNFTFFKPSFELYKDLNSSHTLYLQEDFYEGFIHSIEGKVDTVKGSKLYQDDFLLYIRKAHFHNELYFCARVASEFRKSIEYTVDIKVTTYGCISETQCECAAGKGPSACCKHVLVACEALKDFVKSKDYKSRLTCTEKLQTFHKPKKYTGSPVKIKDLKRPSIEKLKKKLIDFDPRPKKLRKIENYYTVFRNKCINFAGTINGNFPELQLFEPVNFHGLYHDHDYLLLHAEDKFLYDMDIEDISPEKRIEIEKFSRNQAESKYWMHERSIRITSSHFGDVLKSTNYEKTAKELLCPKDLSHLPAIQHGKKFETHAKKKAEIFIANKIEKCGLFVSLSCPYLAASPDGIVAQNTLVEVKCPLSAKNKIISPETVNCLYLCHKEGIFKLKTNHNYYYQIQGQMLCAEKTNCLFIIYTIRDILILNVDRDEVFIDRMVCSLKDFYHKYYRTELLKKYLYKE